LIAAIETDWAKRLEAERFEAVCQGLQDLLDELDQGGSRVCISRCRARDALGGPRIGATRRS
jgi:hypothetical protein